MNNGWDIMSAFYSLTLFQVPFLASQTLYFITGKRLQKSSLLTTLNLIIGAYVPIEILMAFFKFTKVDAGLQQPEKVRTAPTILIQ